jgi:NADH:ubiquinone oxidoreductase subunit K
MIRLPLILLFSAFLFSCGVYGVLARRNAVMVLMAIELMLNAVNLAIIGFASFNPALGSSGSVIALLVMAVAAGEATVGLSIILAIFRNKKTPLVDEYDAMRQ